ncbi:MAG TPA: hypothetical protein VKT27_16540 [Candidatus Binataceae bacterium]|nr:hypothetical protein [Candidatus Binataceae bacterium]
MSCVSESDASAEALLALQGVKLAATIGWDHYRGKEAKRNRQNRKAAYPAVAELRERRSRVLRRLSAEESPGNGFALEL